MFKCTFASMCETDLLEQEENIYCSKQYNSSVCDYCALKA